MPACLASSLLGCKDRDGRQLVQGTKVASGRIRHSRTKGCSSRCSARNGLHGGGIYRLLRSCLASQAACSSSQDSRSRPRTKCRNPARLRRSPDQGKPKYGVTTPWLAAPLSGSGWFMARDWAVGLRLGRHCGIGRVRTCISQATRHQRYRPAVDQTWWALKLRFAVIHASMSARETGRVLQRRGPRWRSTDMKSRPCSRRSHSLRRFLSVAFSIGGRAAACIGSRASPRASACPTS
jgi:hypothetical protein